MTSPRGSPPAFLAGYQRAILAELERLVPPATAWPTAVHESMRHTLFAPAKRVRGVLAFLGAEVCGRGDRAVGVAAAVELVHAASLILDDLPCMDDAAMRRSRPANHLVFGEATALLASFALLSLAFDTVARAYDAPLATSLARLLAETVGTGGLIGGQADDLLAPAEAVTFDRLERIHRLKTGALFVASVTGGAMTAGATDADLARLRAYAKNLGLAFQIVDDLLDVEGDSARTGKESRQDLKKTTFVSFSGAEGARQLAAELCETAVAALTPFGSGADRLRELAGFVAGRST